MGFTKVPKGFIKFTSKPHCEGSMGSSCARYLRFLVRRDKYVPSTVLFQVQWFIPETQDMITREVRIYFATITLVRGNALATLRERRKRMIEEIYSQIKQEYR